MNPQDVETTIAGLGSEIRNRKVSPVEVTRLFLERIERINPILNAYVTVTADDALADATRAEKAVIAARYTAFPFRLKTTLRPKESGPLPVRRFWISGNPTSTRRLWLSSKKPAR
jgi:Amidase